jgi:subtilisin family serine protease/subtilisin-like proprotein convertase family protein
MLFRKHLIAGLAAALAPFALVACFPETVDKPVDPDAKFVRVKNAVVGEYIVVLKTPAGARAMRSSEVAAAADLLLTPFAAKTEQQYSTALQGFSVAELSEADAKALAAEPTVAYVQENGIITLDATQTNATRGLDRIDQRALPLNQTYTYNTDGTGVTAFIIDTGIRATHSNFGGRVGTGFTSINDGQGTNDCQGHGTHVAGTVGSATYGVAKNVQLIPVRVLNCQGSGTDAQVIAGADWVAANHSGPSVANLSLGGDASPALDAAIASMVTSGVTTAVAAGNETQNACNVSPSREPLAITVASTTTADAFSSFSNFGSCVDIAAPGSSITSLSNSSDTATAVLSGTSMASPHVAGAAALYLSANPTATPAQVVAALTSNATAGVLSGVNGSPNLLLFIGFIGGGTANQAPTASITAPANGSTVTGTVTVSANAADADGSVASVRFNLPDGTVITDTTSPYATTWNSTTVANGANYQVRATATDNLGAVSTTAISTVTVSNGGGGACIDGTFNAAGLPLSIPDNNTTGVTSSLAVIGDGTVSTLALSLNITHTYRGDLVVSLVSPTGTSFAVSNRAGGSADNLVLTASAITAFAGQTAAGTWQLKVQDLAGVDVGTINSWSLRIVGNCTPGGGAWSGSATPNLATVDNGQVCSTLSVTATGGQSSAAKLNLSGTHAYRSILRGTLAHNGVTVAAFPTGTFPTGSGTFAFTDRAIAGLSGDAAGAWTLCIVDTDAFADTGVLSSWSVHN